MYQTFTYEGGYKNKTMLEFTIQGDKEGYVTFTCPFCNSDFKLQAGEYQNQEEPFSDLFCPYCGLSKEKSSFLSKDVIEKMHEMATNYAIEEINKAFGKMARSINRNKGIIKMTYKPLKKVHERDLKEKDSQEVEFQCGICNHHVKVLYCIGASKVFCPYCGVDI